MTRTIDDVDTDSIEHLFAQTASELERHRTDDGWRDGAAEAFSRLLRPEIVRAFVERDLRSLLAKSPYHTKDVPAGRLRLYASPQIDVRLRIVRPHAPVAPSIVTLTRHTLVGNAGNAPFTLRCWTLPTQTRNDVFDPATRIVAGADVRLEPGAVYAVAAGTGAYDIDAATRPAVAMTAAGRPVVPTAWHYDRASLRPVRAEPPRKELLLHELLAFAEMLGDGSLAPSLDHISAHPSHFVRWAAAKAARRIAPDGGRAAFDALAADPHPQVRLAARRMLELP